MQHGDRAQIEAVINKINEGTRIFEFALKGSQSQVTQDILRRIIKTRTFASNYLLKIVDNLSNTPTLNHAFGSVLHKMYPDMIERLAGCTPEKEILSSLTAEDEATRKVMQTAAENVNDELLRSVLLDLNPRRNTVDHSSKN